MGPAADSWRKVFKSELETKGLTHDDVREDLNAIGGRINNVVRNKLSEIPGRLSDPIGMAELEDHGQYYYYMMLNKDFASSLVNQATVIAGQESDTVIKLGPFTPEK